MPFDVAMLGFGTVGAMAVLPLAAAGPNALVLERSTEPTDLPLAVELEGESLRAFRRLGLDEEVPSLCRPPRTPSEVARREFVEKKDRIEVHLGDRVVDITQGLDAKLPMTTMRICDPECLESCIRVKDPKRRSVALEEFELARKLSVANALPGARS